MSDVESTLDEIVLAAVDAVLSAVGGGITRTSEGSSSAHATSDDVARLDDLQAELGQGPCIERPANALTTPTSSSRTIWLE